MREHDLLVLGGGTGNVVASAAADAGMDVGLVERGRLGGTCLNRGCNPSKKLIHRANVAETVRTAGEFGVDASLDGVDFAGIVEGITESVTAAAEAKARDARDHDHVAFYNAEGRFVDERVVEVDVGAAEGEHDGGTAADDEIGGDDEGTLRLAADRVVLAGGSRPVIPDSIDGVEETEFLTSDEALRLADRPDRLVVVGGGYVAVEMSHFFGRMGSEVVVVGHGDLLVDREDRAVAERLTDAYREKCELHLGYEATALREDGGETVVTAASESGDEVEVRGDRLLLAVGRRPNTDTWDVAAGGVDTDDDGFVETDECLRTSVDGVYAIGDVAGNYMFKHSGDKEAEYVVDAVVNGEERAVEYPGMAHAIFGSPELASLGRTTAELDEAGVDYEVGTRAYDETALGSALRHEGGFAKALVGDDDEILGCHVVGPEAATLIHEVSTAVAAGGDARTLAGTIHVHPALSEVVQGAFRDACDMEQTGI